MYRYNHVTLVGTVTNKETPLTNRLDFSLHTQPVQTNDKPIPCVLVDSIATKNIDKLCNGQNVFVEGKLQIKEYIVNNESEWKTELIVDMIQFLDPK